MNRKTLIVAVLTLSLGLLFVYLGFNFGNNNSVRKPAVLGTQKNGEVRVVRVIDGDTIEVEIDGKNTKIRLLGIDTPETVDPNRPPGCYGKEASNETKSLLEGKSVILEKDITDVDKYNRLLRYIYLRVDKDQMLFVNDYLVRLGFAKTDFIGPDRKYDTRFISAQEDAKNKKLGLWGKCY